MWTGSELVGELFVTSDLKEGEVGGVASNDRKNRFAEKVGEAVRRYHKHSPRKKIFGRTPVGYWGAIWHVDSFLGNDSIANEKTAATRQWPVTSN
jgi:hypothetical protein